MSPDEGEISVRWYDMRLRQRSDVVAEIWLLQMFSGGHYCVCDI